MKQLFKFKKLSAKFAFIVGTFVVVVAGAVAAYMEYRIITEIGKFTTSHLRYLSLETATECDIAFEEASSDDDALKRAGDIIKAVRLYDTGYALLKDAGGQFLDTGDAVKQLSGAERQNLAGVASANRGGSFDIRLGGVNYLGASSLLYNGWEVYALAPKSEVNAELYASLKRFVVIFIVALSIVVAIAYLIGKRMSLPLAALSGFMRRAAATGSVKLLPEDAALTEIYSKIPDETGQTARDCMAFLEHVAHISEELETIARGDLTTNIELLSEADVMGASLRDMLYSLNDLFRKIDTATKQVASGASQIADGAQSLASGSTEQAATLQQLSASISDITDKTRENAERTENASHLADAIMSNAEKGSRQMEQMFNAVNDINRANQDIGKVIKAIDDIAFQTNILALNAAVEAARAGAAGKGFAVVAEEVRNLAAKSADSAKETGALIANSVEKARLGTQIASDTSKSFEEIVSGVKESAGIISQIASSSEEQTNSISQINAAVGEVAKVVQQNSATSEESAAASEEMSGQSAALEELVSRFKLK